MLEVVTVRRGSPDAASQEGEVRGTFPYMPPEQAGGEVSRLNKRCDVFSLGATLCEILTGNPPYVGKKNEVRAQAREARLGPAFGRLEESGADAESITLAKRCERRNRTTAQPMPAWWPRRSPSI